MTSETDLREQLATCTRIFAMQGMIGVFGHVSVYQPETKTVFITPGMGSDKGSLQPQDMVPTDLDGKPRAGNEGPPVEWPIHTALHGARAGRARCRPLAHALCDAIRHRQARIPDRSRLQGAIFSDGVPLYPEAQLITNPSRGDALLKVDRRQTRRAVARPRHRRRRQNSTGSSLLRRWSWKTTPRNHGKRQRSAKWAPSARRNAAPSAPRSR